MAIPIISTLGNVASSIAGGIGTAVSVGSKVVSGTVKVGKFVAKGAYKLVKGLWNLVTHPVETFKNILKVAAGTAGVVLAGTALKMNDALNASDEAKDLMMNPSQEGYEEKLMQLAEGVSDQSLVDEDVVNDLLGVDDEKDTSSELEQQESDKKESKTWFFYRNKEKSEEKSEEEPEILLASMSNAWTKQDQKDYEKTLKSVQRQAEEVNKNNQMQYADFQMEK